jgi:sodium transport system permease protein
VIRTVRLVAEKELLEALRDRRTLFVALILPVLLYPLMMLGLGPLVSRQRQKLMEEAQPVAVTGGGAQALIRAVIEPPPEEDDEAGAEQEDGAEPAARLLVVDVDDPEDALRKGKITLWLEAADDFAQQLAGQGTGEVVVHRDGSDDKSLAAYAKWRELFASARERLLSARLEQAGFDERWRKPIDVAEVKDVASPERRGAYVFGKVLALLLVLMTVSSSFYPAVDVVAGEKERGTMETLLVAPCGRTELVLGKFVAVLVVTIASAVLNLTSMGLTMGPLMDAMPVEGIAGISVSARVLAGILVLLLPLSMLFSAGALALSTMARSVKEAQHYMTPLFLVVMPLAMVVILPDVPLTRTLAAVPVTSAVLFFRDLMLEKVDFVTTVIVTTTTFATAALALWATVLLFLREESLFRGPEGTGSLVTRPLPRARPGAASAVFLFAGMLALAWYSQVWLPKGFIANVLATQLVVILLPCVALAWWLRVRPRDTFRLQAPRPLPLLLALPIGVATPPLVGWIARPFIGEIPEEGPFHQLEQAFTRILNEQPWWLLVGLLAVLPALLEELVFRGFLLSGLRSAFRGRRAGFWAVLVTAGFFGLFHIYPEKWVTTGLIGLLLGYLTVRTGSLWPAVLCHAANNASTVLVAKLGEGSPLLVLHDAEAAGHGLAVAGSAVVLAACLALVHATSGRADSAPAAPELDAPPEPG